jgi:hypothetical protein
LLNKGRLTRGKGRILSPVGGGLEIMPGGMTYLTSVGATDFESFPDMRFRLPDVRVDQVETWFKRRVNRELSVLREFGEELGPEETKVLTEADLEGATDEFVAYHRYDAETVRDVPEKQTAYFLEIFDVVFANEAAMYKLLLASTLSIEERWVYFVTEREIEKGETDDGVTIGPISRFILA